MPLSSTHPDRRLSRIPLVFGLRVAPIDWFMVRDLAPFAGAEGEFEGHFRLSQVMRKLEEQGLVELVRDQDRLWYRRTERGRLTGERLLADRRLSFDSNSRGRRTR